MNDAVSDPPDAKQGVAVVKLRFVTLTAVPLLWLRNIVNATPIWVRQHCRPIAIDVGRIARTSPCTRAEQATDPKFVLAQREMEAKLSLSRLRY